MIKKIAICLLAAALLPACETSKKTSMRHRANLGTGRYANAARTEPMPPAEGPNEPPPPAEGPEAAAARIPSPLLRNSAAASP